MLFLYTWFYTFWGINKIVIHDDPLPKISIESNNNELKITLQPIEEWSMIRFEKQSDHFRFHTPWSADLRSFIFTLTRENTQR